MTKTEAKKAAQDLILNQIANIGYGSDFEDYCSGFEDKEEAERILKQQMDRIAKMFGYDEAWFY